MHDTRDMPYTYKGESTILPQVMGNFCTACDESILSASESRRTMELMLAFSKQVNASFVDPDFIASVRKKLDLDQREAGEIFGGGAGQVAEGAGSPPGAAERGEGGMKWASLALNELARRDKSPIDRTKVPGWPQADICLDRIQAE